MPYYLCPTCSRNFHLFEAPPNRTATCPYCKKATVWLDPNLQCPEAIGFEFETDVAVSGTIHYQALLFRGKSNKWKIAADGVKKDAGIMEFVTDPLSTMGDIINAVTEMVGCMNALAFSKAQQNLKLDKMIQQNTEFWKNLIIGGHEARSVSWNISAAGCRLGAPQVTMGIPIHKVHALLTEAQKFELSEHLQCKATSKQGQSFLFEELKRSTFSPLLIAKKWRDLMQKASPVPVLDADAAMGLMSLVLYVLKDGFEQTGVDDYAKGALSLVHRTDFCSMYKLLGRAQPWFTVEAVCFCFAAEADETYAAAKVGQASTFLELQAKSKSPSLFKDAPIFRLGFKSGGTYDFIQTRSLLIKHLLPDESEQKLLKTDSVLRGPSIIEWIKSIIAPSTVDAHHRKWDELIEVYTSGTDMPIKKSELAARDLMSRGMCAFDSSSLGRLGVRKQCVLLEFRRWPLTSLPSEYWLSLAARLFDLYSKVCA